MWRRIGKIGSKVSVNLLQVVVVIQIGDDKVFMALTIEKKINIKKMKSKYVRD